MNPELNCFCTVRSEEAVGAARTAAEAVAHGAPLGPLHGVPVALKDTTPTAGHRTTLGSFTHEHWIPDHDVIARPRPRGAIVVGTTTTPEFAHTLVTDSPLWGVTRNPWDPTRTPGGSSGGSAAAVAAGCVPLAEGTDMGGSVRPRVVRHRGLEAGAGPHPDGRASRVVRHDQPPWPFGPRRRRRPPVPGRYAGAGRRRHPLEPGPAGPLGAHVRRRRGVSSPERRSGLLGRRAGHRALRADGRFEEAAGALVDEVDVGLTAAHDESWVDLWAVFMAANYGHLVEQHAPHGSRRAALIERGNRLGAVEYKRLDLVRTDVWRRLAPVLANHDALLCPTTATGPPPAAKADRSLDPPPDDGRHHARDMTGIFNLVSPCPALSVPCGFGPDGLPIRLQIVGAGGRTRS